MIHRKDIGKPIGIVRADEVRVGDGIVVDAAIGSFEGKRIDRVISVERIGDDVDIVTIRRDGSGHGVSFSTSEGNAVIVVR